MQIILESREPDGSQLREPSWERVRFVLRGVDKSCQIELSTEGAGTVAIASLARGWRTALVS